MMIFLIFKKIDEKAGCQIFCTIGAILGFFVLWGISKRWTVAMIMPAIFILPIIISFSTKKIIEKKKEEDVAAMMILFGLIIIFFGFLSMEYAGWKTVMIIAGIGILIFLFGVLLRSYCLEKKEIKQI